MTAPTYDPVTLRVELERDEGVRSIPYEDTTGHMTVGIGHNLSITQSPFIITALYQSDINGCEAALDLHWPWWRQLDPVRQRVLMNMVFNLGSTGLSEFPLFLAAMKAGDWHTASIEMMKSKWAPQVKSRATRLRDMVLSGIDPAAPSTPAIANPGD
jgi:lysozyme